MPPFLRAGPNGIYLQIKVQPRASKNEIGEILGQELKIKLTAPPVDDAANEALLRFLAERLQCPRRAVALVRGQTARHKLVFVQGIDAQSAADRLGQAK
jgi:hypothetical protein